MDPNELKKKTDEEEKAAAQQNVNPVAQAQQKIREQMAAKPGFTSQWQSQLKETMGQILNRKPFTFNLNGNALWDLYKDKYTQGGKMAMMDTMGQAQAMTGGYGNSYAQGVGQQAYQGYMQGLTDKIPELYQLALDMHNQEGDALMNRFGMLSAMDDAEYGRYRDAVGDAQWEQSLQYQKDRDAVGDAQWQAEFDEALRRWNFANGIGVEEEKKGGGHYVDDGYVDPELSVAKMNALNFVKNMLDNASGSRFDPERAIKGTNKLTDQEKGLAQEWLDVLISGGYMNPLKE